MSLFSLFQNKPTDLSPAEFKERLNFDEKSQLIDVRTSSEFSSGSIENARNIDFFSSSFADEMLRLPKEKHYYIYCKSGVRSGKAVKLLQENGYTAFNLKGGILAWS